MRVEKQIQVKAEMQRKTWKSVEEGRGREKQGEAAPAAVAAPAATTRGCEEQRCSGYKILAGQKSLWSPEESVTAACSPFHVFILPAASGLARLSPRSPGRVQRISLLSLQNVGSVMLRHVVFSQPADRPKEACTGGPVPCGLHSFDVTEWRPVGV